MLVSMEMETFKTVHSQLPVSGLFCFQTVHTHFLSQNSLYAEYRVYVLRREVHSLIGVVLFTLELLKCYFIKRNSDSAMPVPLCNYKLLVLIINYLK